MFDPTTSVEQVAAAALPATEHGGASSVEGNSKSLLLEQISRARAFLSFAMSWSPGPKAGGLALLQELRIHFQEVYDHCLEANKAGRTTCVPPTRADFDKLVPEDTYSGRLALYVADNRLDARSKRLLRDKV